MSGRAPPPTCCGGAASSGYRSARPTRPRSASSWRRMARRLPVVRRKKRGEGLKVVPKDPFPVWPIVVALALPVLVIGSRFLPAFFWDKIRKDDLDLVVFDRVLLFLGFPLLIFLIVALLVAVGRRHFRKFLSYAVALSIVATSIFGFKTIIEDLQIVKVLDFSLSIQCLFSFRQNSVTRKYSATEAFGVCSAITHGNSVLSIVYDSGGQIALPVSQQTAEFREFVSHQLGPSMSLCNVILMSGLYPATFISCDPTADE